MADFVFTRLDLTFIPPTYLHLRTEAMQNRQSDCIVERWYFLHLNLLFQKQITQLTNAFWAL